MKKVLLDTNIILDFILYRQEFYQDAEVIFELSSNQEICSFISASSITDLFYIIKKQKNKDIAKRFLIDLTSFIQIANVDHIVIENALNSDLYDFEDAVQDCVAQINQIDIIITRNIKDFKKAKTKIMSPKDFLKFHLNSV
jgi:predicted nucleic acid-binding protein